MPPTAPLFTRRSPRASVFNDLETLPVDPSYKAPLPRNSLVTKVIYSGSRVNFGSEDPYGLSAYSTSGAIRVKAP